MTNATFSIQMEAFTPGDCPKLAIAVSGGADSMALCLLAHEWAKARAGRVVAITIDHKLRPESAAEAQQVGKWLQLRGIKHVILDLPHLPQGNIQQSARELRYAVLEEYCTKHSITHLLTAHHRDDQAETVLMRLMRGSGVDGLSAIAPQRELGKVKLIRPLLEYSKQSLKEYLNAQNQPWIEDASNATGKYARNRIRMALAQECGDDTLAQRLAQTANHMQRVRHALEHATSLALIRCLNIYPEGYGELDVEAWRQEPEEIRLRVLRIALAAISGDSSLLRFDALQVLQRDINGGGLCKTHTLHGCIIRRVSKKTDIAKLVIQREPARMQQYIAAVPGVELLWDKRFLVTYNTQKENVRIGAVGLRMAGVLKKNKQLVIPKRLTTRILATLPALWELEELICVPHIAYKHEGIAPQYCTATFIHA